MPVQHQTTERHRKLKSQELVETKTGLKEHEYWILMCQVARNMNSNEENAALFSVLKDVFMTLNL